MILDKELEAYLRLNFQWEGRKIILENNLRDIWGRANYQPTNQLIGFLVYFYNMQITFNHENRIVDLDFRLKKILEDHPHNLLHEQYCKLLKVSRVVPFAEIEDGYTVLLADDENNIYGVCDNLVETFGKNYYKMLRSFYRNE